LYVAINEAPKSNMKDCLLRIMDRVEYDKFLDMPVVDWSL